MTFALSFENTERRGLGQFKAEPLDCVIPAWSAGIQVDMDVSGGILANLDAGYPCRHDEDLYLLWASVFTTSLTNTCEEN